MFDPAAAYWHRVDAFLSYRAVRWGLAAILSVVFALWKATRMELTASRFVTGIVLVFVLIQADLWLWRRFRARYLTDPSDPFIGVVYGQGVFLWGMLMWITLALFQAYAAAGSEHAFFTLAWFGEVAYGLLPALVVSMPIAFVGGYLGGRAMAAGVQRGTRA